MAGLLRDFRHAFRLLLKNPGFTIAALVVLALGIGANTAIFSIVNGVLLRPLPFDQPDQLVQLWHVPPQQQFPGVKRFSLSAANYLDWEQQNDVFEKSAIYTFTHFRFTGGNEPKEFQASRVEPTFFSVLGVRALIGRTITVGDDQPGHENVLVLSYKLWNTDFGGDRSVVGKNIQLNGQAYTVIGVMPPSFDKPTWASLWTPLAWDPAERVVRGEHHFLAVARLKPGVSVEKAQTQLDTIAARLAQQYPADDAGWGVKVVPLREETVGEVRKPLLILLGAVAFVLLIACANVANLMLAKTLDRRKEIAIRTALGASRVRILRQVLSEAVLLSVAGGALGIIVARFAMQLVINFLGSALPRLNEITMDSRVLAFTFGIAVLTGAAAGLWPAWRLSKSDPNDALKQGLGRTDAASGGKRTRQVLVTVEVALSLMLLVGAGLMVRTLWNLRKVNPGFEAQHVLTMTVAVTSTDYAAPEPWIAFFDEALRHVRALPGVQAAGVTDSLPMQGGSNQPVAVEGYPVVDMAHQPEVSVRMLTPGFVETMHIPLLRGRVINDSDTASSNPVVVISESMAKQFWPNQDPIGKRLALTFVSDTMREVVGVVGDVKDKGLASQAPVSTLYWPISQFYFAPKWGKFHGYPLQLAVRTSTDPADATTAIRNSIHEVSPGTPLLDVKTMDDLVAESISPQRFNMVLLAAFAGLALLLAAVGIYSVLAYTVRQRTREIGLRMALGAQIRDVLRMIVFDGMKPTLLGVAIGLAASIALSRVLSTLVFGVKATDIATFLTVSAILVSVGMFASVLPAWRATRVDPLKTLRDE
jgi:putative ABC transport system permease protein